MYLRAQQTNISNTTIAGHTPGDNNSTEAQESLPINGIAQGGVAVKKDILTGVTTSPQQSKKAPRPGHDLPDNQKNSHPVLNNNSFEPRTYDTTHVDVDGEYDFDSDCGRATNYLHFTHLQWLDCHVITDPAQSKQATDNDNRAAEQHRINQVAEEPDKSYYARFDPSRELSHAPDIKVETTQDFLQGGAASSVGRRTEKESGGMQDSHLTGVLTPKIGDKDIPVPIVGVFDGHGSSGLDYSKSTQELCKQTITEKLEQRNPNKLTNTGIRQALHLAMVQLNCKIKHMPQNTGTTACVSLVANGNIWTANVGDSRAIIVNKDGSCLQLSEDASVRNLLDDKKIQQSGATKKYHTYVICHEDDRGHVVGPRHVVLESDVLKDSAKETVKEIFKRGGYICYWYDSGRISRAVVVHKKRPDGCLPLYRVLGNAKMWSVPSPVPGITSHPITPDMQWVLHCCDGAYERISTNDMGKVVHTVASETGDKVARRVVDTAYTSRSGDNITAVAIPAQEMLARSQTT